MRRLFADRNARWYLSGQMLSLFGDTSMFLAMGIWVKELTGSSAQAGLTFFFFAAATTLAPFAGVVVDRLPRRAVLIWSNLASAAVVLALLDVHGRHQVWLIWVVAFLYGLGSNFLSAAQSALLVTMLPDDQLVEANSVLRTAREGFRLVGPLVGAGLFAALGGGAVAILDAATFVLATGTLVMVKVDERRREPTGEAWWAEVSAGARHLWSVVVLRQVAVTVAVACLVVGFLEPVSFAVVGQGLHRKATFLGILISVQGIGAVAGGVTSSAIIRRLREGPVVGIGLVLIAIGSALFTASNMIVVFAGAIVLGVSLPWLIVAANTLMQRRTPNELQGRTSAAFDTLASVPQTISIAVGASLLAVVDYRLLLLAVAVVILLSAVYLLTRSEQWVRTEAVAVPAVAGGTGAAGVAGLRDLALDGPATVERSEGREPPAR
jgi:MFS family permease